MSVVFWQVIVCLLWVFSLSPSALSTANVNGSPIAIVDVSVIPMDTQRKLEHQTVIIREGKISRIGPYTTEPIPDRAEQISGKGKFLMPGLIDAHVHLLSPDDLISYLAYGITTVVNMSGTPSDLKIRDEVQKGLLLGPNVYTAGPTIDGYPPLNEIFVTAETPQQGDDIVVSNKRAGYDFVKVYGTLRPDVFRAIAEACKREHMTLVGHVNRQMPTRDVFAAGQVMAAHAEDLLFAHFDHPPSDQELAKFADEIAAAGVTVTANIAVNPATVAQVKNLGQVLSSNEAQYLSAATYSRWIKANNRNLDQDPKQQLEALKQAETMDMHFVRLLSERQVQIILGTDAAAYGFPGESVWREIEQTGAAGLPRFEALATATRNAGTYLTKYVNNKSRLGKIEEGAQAELLLMNSNPLETDFTQAALDGVILRGKWLPISVIGRSRDQLRKRLLAEHELVLAADEQLERGNIKRVRAVLSKNSSHSPLLDEWVLLTKARKNETQLPVAIAIAKLYTEQFPDRFSSHQLLADLLQKSGNNRGAQAEAETALKLQPHSSTAEAILKRATISARVIEFSPGSFRLEFEPRSDTSTSILLLEKKRESWSGSLKTGGNATPIRVLLAGGDQLWFKTGQDWQEKEIRLSISRDGIVSGSWWSMFGKNGRVNGHVIKN